MSRRPDPVRRPGAGLAERRFGRWSAGVLELGAGEPVVFLHGSADTAFAWKAVCERVAVDHRALSLDLGSARASDGALASAPDAAGHFERDRDFLRSVLASLEAPAHVVAHSYGALLALRHGLDEPLRIRTLTLTEPIAFGLMGDPSVVEGERSYVRGVLDRFLDEWADGRRERAIEVIVDYWNGGGAWRAVGAEHRERILLGAERFHREVACAHADRTTLSELGSLSVPTLVVSGAETTRAAGIVCDLVAGAVPGARGLRVARAGHSPMRSHPDAVAEAWRRRIAGS